RRYGGLSALYRIEQRRAGCACPVAAEIRARGRSAMVGGFGASLASRLSLRLSRRLAVRCRCYARQTARRALERARGWALRPLYRRSPATHGSARHLDRRVRYVGMELRRAGGFPFDRGRYTLRVLWISQRHGYGGDAT